MTSPNKRHATVPDNNPTLSSRNTEASSSTQDEDEPDSKKIRLDEALDVSDIVDSTGKIITNETPDGRRSDGVKMGAILNEVLDKLYAPDILYTIESNIPIDLSMVRRDKPKTETKHNMDENITIPIYKLKIGEWKVGVDETLTIGAMIFYRSEIMGWELSKNGVKFKIEFQWNDVAAIHADGDIFSVELMNKPQLYRELDGNKGDDIVWEKTSDFTNGEALDQRIHTATFFPGELLTHFTNICNLSDRLKNSSQDIFPSLPSYHFCLSMKELYTI